MIVYCLARKTDEDTSLLVRNKATTIPRANNEPPVSLANILHWTVPFCIALCSVDLFGSAAEISLVTELDDDEGQRRS